MNEVENYKNLDLRGTACPLNFVRCRLALESLEINQKLMVFLDKGEPEKMVISGLKECGYKVQVISEELNFLRLIVETNCG